MTNYTSLLRILREAGIDFIVIGGAAATVHGSARLTLDLDVVYRRSPDNHDRMASALRGLEPYLRGAPPGLPFRLDAATLARGLNFTLTTSIGDLDIFGEVPGGGSYEDLLDHTFGVEVAGVTCLCVDLDALIKMKRAAGRPKDIEVIAELEILAEREPGE